MDLAHPRDNFRFSAQCDPLKTNLWNIQFFIRGLPPEDVIEILKQAVYHAQERCNEMADHYYQDGYIEND